MKSGEKMTCWNKKGIDKKYTMLKNKKEVFYEKMFVRIKDDRDNVTRPRSEN